MASEDGIKRRDLMKAAVSTTAAFTIVPRSALGGTGHVAPSDKLNLAFIGTGTQGIRLITEMLPRDDVRIVAVCDPNAESTDYVDWSQHGLRNKVRKCLEDSAWGEGVDGIRCGRRVAKEIVETYYAQNKGCAEYADFRDLLENEKDLDAVEIITPDHLHATIAIAAMKAGKHAATHKPISNVLYETRLAVDTARETRMRSHLLACKDSPWAYVIKDWIGKGLIGPVREVHNWLDKPVWPQGALTLPSDRPPVPEGFDWDLWLGPVPHRPYSPRYTHAVFRGWYDFGSGCLGDMGHYSLWHVFRILDLGAPHTVEAAPSLAASIIDGVSRKQWSDVAYPHASTIRFRYPARGEHPPVDLFWYDGGMRPTTPPELYEDNTEMPVKGMMFVGDEGKIMAGFQGEEPRLIPEKRMRRLNPDKSTENIPVVDSDDEWVNAFRGGKASLGDFEHARHLCESICLGNVALRLRKRIVWDDKTMKTTNIPEANKYLRRNYREDWEL
jgi:hypothetical protein